LALTLASRGSLLWPALAISWFSTGCCALGATSLMADQSGCRPFRAGMSFSTLATSCWPALEVPSQMANVVAALMCDDLALTARPGNGMATAGNGLGLATPAPEMAAVMPSVVSYCIYQVPIMTMASLPDRKALSASGYCCTPSAPGSMIPSEKSCFQMDSVL